VTPTRAHGLARRVVEAGTCLLAAVLVALASATHAYADPSVSDLERQIDQAWQRLEPIIEQYNGVHVQLVDNQAKVADLQKRIEPLQLQVDVAATKVSQIAASAYKLGAVSQLNAILAGGSPTTLADQLSRLNQVAFKQRQQISGVVAVRDKYRADKKALDELVTRLSQQDADLAAKKKDIEAQVKNLQDLRQRAYGGASVSTGGLRTGLCPAEYTAGAGGVAAAKACSLIGKPNIWGAAGPAGYDCSGLTMTAWAAAGVALRHYTRWQWQDTRAVSRADLRPGDLVFYYSDLHHVSVYVGANTIVHAPHSGDYVRMAPLDRMPVAGYRRPG
jgi:cell wall-associated NlpC family hydrolase